MTEPVIEAFIESHIEAWAQRAMQRWPNVPHLYGWLRLDRRGRWLIKDEVISRPQIVDTINANYGADERGAWYFQNGPQRGYVALDAAPLILSAPVEGDALSTHLGTPAGAVSRAAIDEQGGLWLLTARGPGWLTDRDLDWALQRLVSDQGLVDEARLATVLALPPGATTGLALELEGQRLVLERIDEAGVPAAFGFLREPTAPATP
ncbi:DUF2946 family protein [Nevskia sp.]|uniref:DUF2946 family protein n=1 Tax=Nevskia sp. TaxID=1929292 RepID=UPI0025D3AAE5|nr:DUF2946 family protein [Nevskia sp.]